VSTLKFDNTSIRFDLQIIAAWVAPNSRVLDLGCGAGDLLYYLKTRKKVHGTGIEHDEEKVAQCVEKGVTVLQGDINAEVHDYPDEAFDTVILSQTLQQVYEPAALLGTILRIGKKAVVSFPNFGHSGAPATAADRLCAGHPATPLRVVRHTQHSRDFLEGFQKIRPYRRLQNLQRIRHKGKWP